jgi:hypothetical protein
VKTSWCFPPPGLPGRTTLSVSRSGDEIRLAWRPEPSATAYDVVRGDVGQLRASAGDYTQATRGCAANNLRGTELLLASDIPPGAAEWYLLRTMNCVANGTYDESIGLRQEAPRDFAIDASASSCP